MTIYQFGHLQGVFMYALSANNIKDSKLVENIRALKINVDEIFATSWFSKVSSKWSTRVASLSEHLPYKDCLTICHKTASASDSQHNHQTWHPHDLSIVKIVSAVQKDVAVAKTSVTSIFPTIGAKLYTAIKNVKYLKKIINFMSKNCKWKCWFSLIHLYLQ